MSIQPLTHARRWLPSRLPFYYGWVMLPIAMIGIIATSPGQTFIVSVFNPSFREALSLTHSQLTGAYMAGTFLAALPQPYFGALMDRFGIRRTMAVVVIVFALACLFASSVSSLFTLFLAFLMLRMFGQGALSLLSNNTIAMWFQTRLGLVSGMVNVGVSGAFAILPVSVLALIQTQGWRNAYIILGLVVVMVMFPLLAFFYHNHPRDVGQNLDGTVSVPERGDSTPTNVPYAVLPSFDLAAARRTRAYWIITLASTAWGMIATAVFFNIIPLFAESGLTEAEAASTFAFLSVSMAITHVIGGIFADRLPLNWLAAASMGSLILGIITLLGLDSVRTGQLYGIFFGFGQGMIGVVGSTLWVRYYGRTHLGKIRGSIWTFTVAGTSVGPFIMGFTFDQFGSYRASLFFFLALLIPITIAALWATPPEKEI